MYVCIYAAYCIHIQKCRIISKQFLLNGWWLPIPKKVGVPIVSGFGARLRTFLFGQAFAQA